MTTDSAIKITQTVSLVVIIIACLLPLQAQQELYTVESFDAGLRTIAVAGNSIIAPSQNDTLVRLQKHTALGTEELLLRRRFGPAEYGLYLGKRNRDSFDNLSAFAAPSGMTTNSLLHLKVYMSETDNPNMDLANVYFDEEYIYVENAVKIFFYENGWKSLAMVERFSGKLTVTSAPESATVFIDGVERGKTPLTLENLRSPYCIIKVFSGGYYQAEVFAYCAAGTEVVRHIILTPMIAPVEGAYCNPFTYTSESPASVDELDRQIKILRQRIVDQKEAIEESLAGYEKNYPQLKDQGEFEKTEDFLVRKDLYEEKKKSGRMALVAEGNPRVYRLEDELLRLTNYRTEIEHRLYYHFLSTKDIVLNRYEADMEYFPVDIRVNQSGHRFVFTGLLQIPLSLAADFKDNIHRGRLKLTYKNRIFPAEETKLTTKILYEYVKISILFRGGEYVLEGKCSFPGKSQEGDVVAQTAEDTLTIKKRGK